MSKTLVMASVYSLLAVAYMLTPSAKAVEPASGLDGAASIVRAATTPGKFVPPGPAFDARSCMTGKKVMVIPMTSSNPFSANVARSMKAAAQDVGVELRVFDNQFDVKQWAQGIQVAIAEKYDLIDLSTAPAPEMLRPQIQQARAAGIKVVVSHWFDADQTAPSFIDGASLAPFSESMRVLSAWTISKTNGHANVLFVNSDEVTSAPAAKKAIVDTFKQLCPTCNYKFLNVPLSDWSTRLTPAVQSALLADPAINYVVPFYDGMSQFVTPAVSLAGRQDVRVASFNGTPFVLDMVRSGKVEMDVGESVGWIGWAALDYDMRKLCGVTGSAALNVPLKIFDKSNIASAGVPASYDSGYGDTYINGFRTLWKLK